MAGAAVRHLSNAIKIEMAMTLLDYPLTYKSIMESDWHDARASPLDCATHDLVMEHTFANDGVPLQRSLSRKNGDEHDSLSL